MQRQSRKNRLKPLALYLHIPFCVRKCLYCDFLSFSSQDAAREMYFHALLREIKACKSLLYGKYVIQTIFIGGGTPTCLSPHQLDVLGETLQELSKELSKAEPSAENPMLIEFTIEANPGTIQKDHVTVFQDRGVNRISLGLQSAQDQELQALGRIHTYEDFLKSYDLLRSGDIKNINVDLMADIPLQTVESYQDTLQKILHLRPEHISSYSLIVEEGTPFYQMQQKGRLSIPDEETDRRMYELTKAMLKEQGYDRYEISNYAKQGKECRHNISYWKLQDYLGLGLGASSYLDGCRFRNPDDMQRYLHSDFSRMAEHRERHVLSQKEEMEEFVFLGLRMMEGISLSEYRSRFGTDFKIQYQTVLPEFFRQRFLAEDTKHGRIYLTDRGIDVSNRILAEFLLEE